MLKDILILCECLNRWFLVVNNLGPLIVLCDLNELDSNLCQNFSLVI